MTIRAKTLLMVTVLLATAVLATTGVLGWSTRQALLAETEAQGLVIARLLARSAAFGHHVMDGVETAIGEQMIVEATIAAHFVAVAEAANLSTREINARLQAITRDTILEELWITDETGHAYLSSTGLDFTFSPDPAKQPQAYAFWSLLTSKMRTFVQDARKREVDDQVYKYAGVAGVDKPRIVQVGYRAAFIERLQSDLGLPRLIDHLVAGGNVISIRVLDSDMATLGYADKAAGGAAPSLPAEDVARFRELVREHNTAAILKDTVLTVFAPIGEEGGDLKGGAILVALPTDNVQNAIRGQARLAIVVSGAVLLLGSIIALIAAKTITRPIDELTELTRRIARGELAQTIRVRGRSELAVLARSFNEMSRKLAASIDHLKETTAAKERIESELKIAREIQMSMVPKIFPPFPARCELDIYAAMLPAKEVGGDLYDFFFVDDHRLCVAIGDVSGKGVPAALFMAVTRTLLRAESARADLPDHMLSRLNRELCRDNESCMFVTLFCGILDTRNGRFDYSNAGHNLPYRIFAGGVVALENTGGAALGLSEATQYRTQALALDEGDCLFLYTDGVTEAMDAKGLFFSERLLEGHLAARKDSGTAEIVRSLLAELAAYAADVPQYDDVTTLALRYNGHAARSFEIRIGNALAEIEKVHAALAAFCLRHHLTARLTHDIELAIEEIAVNAITHAYDDEEVHEIGVRGGIAGDRVVIAIEYEGRAFDPTAMPPPDVEAPLEKRQAGGLGIHLVRKLMDSVEYEREGTVNRIVMTRPVERSQA